MSTSSTASGPLPGHQRSIVLKEESSRRDPTRNGTVTARRVTAGVRPRRPPPPEPCLGGCGGLDGASAAATRVHRRPPKPLDSGGRSHSATPPQHDSVALVRPYWSGTCPQAAPASTRSSCAVVLTHIFEQGRCLAALASLPRRRPPRSVPPRSSSRRRRAPLLPAVWRS